MLSIREFGLDTMMIVTIFPMEDKEREKALIKIVQKRFLKLSNLYDENSLFHITSLYWQRLANASDPVTYDHVAGMLFFSSFIVNIAFYFFLRNYFKICVIWNKALKKLRRFFLKIFISFISLLLGSQY